MYQIIENMEQIKLLHYKNSLRIPDKVMSSLQEKVQLLNSCYGEHRNIQKDLGGYCIVFHSEFNQAEYEEVLEHRQVVLSEYEYRKIICEEKFWVWIEELFLLGSDYGIVVFHAERRE